MTLLQRVKMAVRVVTDDFNEELTRLINACVLDLGCAGVTADTANADELVVQAVCTYCKLNFGDAVGSEYDRLKASYDEQKAQMSMRTGYTVWQ